MYIRRWNQNANEKIGEMLFALLLYWRHGEVHMSIYGQFVFLDYIQEKRQFTRRCELFFVDTWCIKTRITTVSLCMNIYYVARLFIADKKK